MAHYSSNGGDNQLSCLGQAIKFYDDVVLLPDTKKHNEYMV